MTSSPDPSVFSLLHLLPALLSPNIYHFITPLPLFFSLHPSSQRKSAWIQWFAFWMPAEKAAKTQHHHKRVTPRMNGPEQYQNLTVFHRSMYSQSVFKSLFSSNPQVPNLSWEQTESIMKELSFQVLNMRTCYVSRPRHISFRHSGGPVTPSLPPSQNLITDNYSFSLLYIYSLPFNKTLFVFF